LDFTVKPAIQTQASQPAEDIYEFYPVPAEVDRPEVESALSSMAGAGSKLDDISRRLETLFHQALDNFKTP